MGLDSGTDCGGELTPCQKSDMICSRRQPKKKEMWQEQLTLIYIKFQVLRWRHRWRVVARFGPCKSACAFRRSLVRPTARSRRWRREAAETRMTRRWRREAAETGMSRRWRREANMDGIRRWRRETTKAGSRRRRRETTKAGSWRWRRGGSGTG
jgi:hypothetical protein